ncbi:MAG: hypothetical protein DI535_15795 [Citrobacter freundii]|nr:MAG: hypothetical protein DI535_15795 [Citrobacter freundii]
MRRILSCRNIASFLFIATLFVFVLAQRYTRENFQAPGEELGKVDLLINKEKQAFTENEVKDSSDVKNIAK